MNNAVFKRTPAVFAVGNTYQIMIPVKKETLMHVKIGEHEFYDHVNGTLRSNTDIHRITVPQKLLDEKKEYTVCYRVVKKRKPYFTNTEDLKEAVFSFYPVTNSDTKAFLIADTHNKATPAVTAAKCFEEKYGEIDFLILARDIPSDSGKTENFDTIYEIAEQLTGGSKPIVYAKGNHDLRGICAEKAEEYAPQLNGKSYFTFKIGNIWGISLDCGEDKDDSHEEYGYTVCCRQFRNEETEFIKDTIKNANNEYLSESVRHKIVVCHNPFYENYAPPFNIEKEIYGEWCALLKKDIKPHIMLCGHLHEIMVKEAEKEQNGLTPPCKVIVGAKPFKTAMGKDCFVGTGLFFTNNGIKYVFTDNLGKSFNISE